MWRSVVTCLIAALSLLFVSGKVEAAEVANKYGFQFDFSNTDAALGIDTRSAADVEVGCVIVPLNDQMVDQCVVVLYRVWIRLDFVMLDRADTTPFIYFDQTMEGNLAASALEHQLRISKTGEGAVTSGIASTTTLGVIPWEEHLWTLWVTDENGVSKPGIIIFRLAHIAAPDGSSYKIKLGAFAILDAHPEEVAEFRQLCL